MKNILWKLKCNDNNHEKEVAKEDFILQIICERTYGCNKMDCISMFIIFIQTWYTNSILNIWNTLLSPHNGILYDVPQLG
jgi:hypothetical protein